MIIRALTLAALTLFSINSASFHTHADGELCEGFLPENDLQVPVSIFQVGGLNEADFHKVLDRVESHFAPLIAARGATLRIQRDWSSSTVNASASRTGNTYNVRMYGGLARHHTITQDGFMLVACHEVGHHIGGAPKVISWWGAADWATNEGGADYFATLRCLRSLYDARETQDFVSQTEIDSILRAKCEETYQTQDEENFCMRSGMAGLSTAKLFHDLRKLNTELRFDTPDSSAVSQTDDNHPEPQCRLDTYFQGALCVHDAGIELSDTDPTQGTCSEFNGQQLGLRPRCWFKP